MTEKKIVQAHDDIKRLIEISHYEEHAKREESAEFREAKKKFHEMGAKCWIDNKHCCAGIEIHHNIVEYSASSEIDWERFHADHPDIKDVDSFEQMLPLCEVHHRGKFHGIHSITYPIWVLQKYMTDEALDKFQKAIDDEIKKEKNHD